MGEYHQITLSEWMEQKEQLRKELNNIREGFVRVGYVLRKMEESRAYEAEGYKSVAEFAEKEHGLKPSTTSRWMSINKEFSVDGYSMQLDPKYIDMNASQLTEMLTLSVEDREMVRPETQRESIRELKRLEKEEPPKESGLEQIVRLFLEENEDIHMDIISWMTFRPADQAGLIERMNPSGNRSFRKNGMMLMMYEDYIKFKTAGKKPETVEWSEFFEIAGKIELPKDEEERIDGAAAVEEPAESAGEESPEGSRREVAESRGMDDERREEVGGENRGSEVAGEPDEESRGDGIRDRDSDDHERDSGGDGKEHLDSTESDADGINDREGREGHPGASESVNEQGDISGEVGEAGREGREADPLTGRDEREGEGKAEETEVCQAGDPVGEKAGFEKPLPVSEVEEHHAVSVNEGPADYTQNEESADRGLTDDFNAPEGVGNVDKPVSEKIAPAQKSEPETIVNEDGSPSPENAGEAISGLKKNAVVMCMDLNRTIQMGKWDQAESTAELLLRTIKEIRQEEK